MERFWLAAFFTLTCFNVSYSLILALRNPNGSLDVEHLIGHITLLEQVFTAFQQTVKSEDTDIVALKTEILNLKANQQLITSHHADIATLKNEIVNLKANQQKLDNRIFDLQKHVQPGQILAEMTSLKNEVIAAKTEVTQVSNEVIFLTSRFSNLTQDYQTLSSKVQNGVNATKKEVAWVSNEVTSKFSNLTRNYQTLSSQVKNEVNAAKTKVTQVSSELISLTSKFSNLTRDYQTLSSQVTNEVNAAKTKVTQVSSKVISLSSKFSSLTQQTTALSADIALLKTEVGFNIWLGTSNVNLTASTWTTLKFRDIGYNIGDGYNTTAGVFTAPVSGTYLFWTEVKKISGSFLDLYLRKGNSYIGQFMIRTTGEVTGFVITTTSVTTGEQVYVDILGADTVYGSDSSRFGGALLYRH